MRNKSRAKSLDKSNFEITVAVLSYLPVPLIPPSKVEIYSPPFLFSLSLFGGEIVNRQANTSEGRLAIGANLIA